MTVLPPSYRRMARLRGGGVVFVSSLADSSGSRRRRIDRAAWANIAHYCVCQMVTPMERRCETCRWWERDTNDDDSRGDCLNGNTRFHFPHQSWRCAGWQPKDEAKDG